MLRSLRASAAALARRLPRAAAELALALTCSVIAAVGFTWPLASDLSGQVIGGGELGGWLWRIWWHFQEVVALQQLDLGPVEHLRQLVSLGRFPETGNILDILLISYLLDAFTDFPVHHNLKVLVVLVGNGVAAYALARTVTRHPLVAVVASMVAIFNPLVIQDVNGTGLRQVLLWWVLLFPVALLRALRTTRPLDGVIVGLAFTAVSAFYWFYGLFTAMAAVVLLAFGFHRDRAALRRAPRWVIPAGITAVVGVALFLLPYFQAGGQDVPGVVTAVAPKGMFDLPETTFGVPFPPYDAIADAPLRPSSYEENVLASLHRVIDSSWALDYVVNPKHGTAAFPLVVFLVGVVPALRIRAARPWLAVWFLFYLGTLGPFLKLGARGDTGEIVMLGDFVIRLPYTIMFQLVPGMSRMFGPYRMASLMVVAAVPLVALGLSQLRSGRWRIPASLAFLAGLVFQPYYHVSGPVAEGSIPPPAIQPPLWISHFEIPDWYLELPDPQGDALGAGIIEMPFDQQQDLLMAYQARHGRPVYYQNWATRTAVPPLLRGDADGPGGRLIALSSERHRVREVDQALRGLSTLPIDHDLSGLSTAALREVVEDHGYRWLVVHESGYLYVDLFKSGQKYKAAVRKLADYLGQEPQRFKEFDAGNHRDDAMLPAWVPQPSRATLDPNAPFQAANTLLEMAVFDLEKWAASLPPEEDPAEEQGAVGEEAPGADEPAVGPATGAPASVPHTAAPPGAPLPTR